MLRLPRLLRASPVLYASRASKSSPALDDPTCHNALATALEKRSKELTGRGLVRGPARRVSVVNEKLCEDALDLLAPSLKAYKGCDILDILPGAGLWSRKVHERLEPQSHTLIDINQDAFDPFLRELANSPDSKYQYKSFDLAHGGASAKQRRSAFNESTLLDHVKETASHGGSQRPLLVLGTTTTFPYPYHGNQECRSANRKLNLAESIGMDSSPSEEFLYDMTRQISLLPEDEVRPLKFLLWTLDRDKFNIIPRSVAGRRVAAVELDESFSMQEIAGWSQIPRRAKGLTRSAHYEISSAFAVAKRMNEASISIPEDRQSPMHRRVLEELSKTSQPSPIQQDLTRLSELEYVLSLETLTTSNRRSKDARTRKATVAREVETIQRRLETFMGSDRTTVDGRILIDLGEQLLLHELEKSIALGKPTHPVVEHDPSAEGGFCVRNRRGSGSGNILEETDKKLALPALATTPDGSGNTLIGPRPNLDKYLYVAHGQIDNHSSLFRPTPLLTWDRRSFEPLEVREEDFWPTSPLSLIQMTVRERSPRTQPTQAPDMPALRSDTPDQSPPQAKTRPRPLMAKPFPQALLKSDALPLPTALDRIAHGCSAALLPNCPSITDPLRGGRLPQNLHQFRVRMLTKEHWTDLVTAWYAWPFRRGDLEMEGEVSRRGDEEQGKRSMFEEGIF